MPKREMPEPYRIADIEIETLSRRILRETAAARRRLSVLKFDELNVLKETDALYETIGRESRKVFHETYFLRYLEIWNWLKGTKPDEEKLDGLVEMYLTGLWEDPDERTHYAFGPELDRKRDRAKEAIVSVPTKVQKQLELEKAARYVIQQGAWYCDFCSQDAEIQAMKDAGVQWVMRHEMDDEKTCSICREADGRVYRIENIPPLEHLRCRRWFSNYNK